MTSSAVCDARGAFPRCAFFLLNLLLLLLLEIAVLPFHAIAGATGSEEAITPLPSAKDTDYSTRQGNTLELLVHDHLGGFRGKHDVGAFATLARKPEEGTAGSSAMAVHHRPEEEVDLTPGEVDDLRHTRTRHSMH